VISRISTKDGALGFTDSATPYFIVGQATQGSTTTPATFGDSGYFDVYGVGTKLTDRASIATSQGVGPLTLLRMATSTASAIPAYNYTLHAAFAGNDASNTFPGPITQPVAPRNVEAVFAASYDGGDITVVGTAEDKLTAQTETIAATANTTVKGSKVFGTITSITKGAVGNNAATVTIKAGNKSSAASGTDSQLVFAGTPIDDDDVIVKITRAGDVGTAPYPAFAVSFDGGDTFGPETACGAAGAMTLGHGLTATLSGAAVKVSDTFRTLTTGPKPTSGDLTAALAVLSTLNNDGGEVHFLGGMSGAQAAVITTWLASERAAGRDWVAYIESRDKTVTNGVIETNAAFIASVNTDYVSVLEPVGCLAGVPGWWETVIPNGGIKRRPMAWNAVTQVWSLPYWVNPVSVQDGGGPVPGFYTPSTPGVPNTHDERLTPGLGGSSGRWMTLQSFPGVVGQWFISDAAGLRSPGTFAAGTSDWSLLMYARIGNRARRFLQRYAVQLLGGMLDTKADGTLTGAELKRLKAKTERALGQALKGAVQSVQVDFSATEVTKTSKRIPYLAKLKTFAYVLEVDGTIVQAL
jgi:hypothetical protein